MNAQTVQKITTMSEFIHSEGMEFYSKEFERRFLLDGTRRPCTALYRTPAQFNIKNFSARLSLARHEMFARSARVARCEKSQGRSEQMKNANG